ncbi:hypothetical protein Cpir12675_003035 [Ceratocystis pirilliformis]|uniref:Vacuolar protein sorting-associated protein 51 homolog n=1 Tax=Ceratocystis pirilliformis TaxID=259994 RepID=A0ABR3Z7L6_9PEZI
MSTIASPRDSSLSLSARRLPGTPTLTSPVGSSRPSIDTPRSSANSPVLPPAGLAPAGTAPLTTSKRKNRAALREYYNLQRGPSPVSSVQPDPDGLQSEVDFGELDAPKFDSAAYVRKVSEELGLEELLKVYTKILGETRALDAEKKALVYDNYNKLIAATETIRKMRANMDPLNPIASTLDPKMAQIYEQASVIRQSLQESVPEPSSETDHSRRMRQIASDVLNVPARLRYLVGKHDVEAAEKEWKLPRKLLLDWKEKGIGGEEVCKLLEEGDRIIREAATEGSRGEGDDSASEE